MVLTNVDDGHIRRIIGHKLREAAQKVIFFRGQANKRGGGVKGRAI